MNRQVAAECAPLAVRLAAELAQHALDGKQLASLLLPHAVHLQGNTLFNACRTGLAQAGRPRVWMHIILSGVQPQSTPVP